MTSWRQCAEYYLKQLWCAQDRRLIRAFSGSAVTGDMLHDLCCGYGVARNIPGSIDEIGVEKKYKPFAAMLNTYRDTEMTKDNAADIIDSEVVNLNKKYGCHLWSAISKAFWMMKQHPIVIYDSFALKGLRTVGPGFGDKTYRQYFDACFKFFETPETQAALDDACSWLITSPAVLASLVDCGLNASQLERMTSAVWFMNRVVDVWLCQKGGAKWVDGSTC